MNGSGRPIGRRKPFAPWWHGLLLAALFGLSGAGSADSTRVYRCTGEDGQVEFRQGPCVEGLQQELEIEDVEVGWEAPAATVERNGRPRKTAAKKNRISSSRTDQKKREEKCLKTEQRLENINRKLRRGYKAGKGADLRHKRRQYEEYLDRLCS